MNFISKRYAYLAIIILAIILGYAIYNQQKIKLLSISSPSPSPNITSHPRLLPSNLTEDERFILHPPPADASRSALKKHAQTVAKLAKLGDELEIKDCQPTPLVLQIKQGSELKVKNDDKVDHRIILDEDHQYSIPTNSSTKIKAEFKYGTGDYGYVCVGGGLVGFLHVVP